MLTFEQLTQIMPGLPEKKAGALLPFLQAAMTEFAIEVPARAAAFLAQLAHESGQFRFMEELWGPTPAQQRYEPQSSVATTLGNIEAGDGRRFKGRGPIQITGRANYQRFGDTLGIQLVADPPQAALPELAFRIAGLFWSKKGLNELADLATGDAFGEITRRINGGFNGLEERRTFYATACAVLGVIPGAASRGAPVPTPAAELIEPIFERGYEAIRSAAAPRAGRKTKSAGRNKTIKRRAAAPRRTKAVTARSKAATPAKRREPAAPKARPTRTAAAAAKRRPVGKKRR